MRKIWLVAVQEYRRHVLARRFVFGLLSVPLVILLLVGLVFLIIEMDIDTTPIGYVDASGLLAQPVPGPKPTWPNKPVPMLPFQTESAARAALEAGKIQAYYVLPADYRTNGDLRVVHSAALKDSSRSEFYNFLAANVLRNTDPVLAKRLVDGSNVTVTSADGTRSLSGDNILSFLLPMVVGIGFIIAMFTSGGYLMQAVVEEKENRTMEVVITSVTPNQLMAGKILGDTAIGLTQILAWILFIAIPIAILQRSTKFLQGISVSAQTLVVMLVVLLPAFVVVAALMAMIGATVSEAREGQQMTGLISLPIWIPYALVALLMSNPNSPIALVLSFLPLTAPVTMLMRDGLTILPAWQIALSSGIQVLAAVGLIWVAGRAFRLGMLRYGQKLALKEIFARTK